MADDASYSNEYHKLRRLTLEIGCQLRDFCVRVASPIYRSLAEVSSRRWDFRHVRKSDLQSLSQVSS